MWQQIKKLTEERGAKILEMRGILKTAETEKRELTGEESTKFDAMTAETESMAAQIKRLDAAYRNADGTIGDGHPGRGAIAGQENRTAEDLTETRALRPDETAVSYIRARMGRAANDAADAIGLGKLMRAMVMGPTNDAERRALSEGTDSAGGYTSPALTSAEFIDKLRARTHTIAAGARIVPLLSNKTSFARILTDPTPGWRAESASVAVSDPTFDRIQFLPKSLAVLFKASRELLEDSININEAIQTALAGVMAVELDRVGLVGSGASNQPTGISLTSGVASVSMGTNGAALVDYSKLLDAIYSLALANAADPTAALMHPRTRRTLDGLVDLQNNPLQRPKALEKLPLLATTSLPINETQGSSSVASRCIIGDFTQLWFGIRSEMRIEVLKERYADTMEYAFLCHLRADVAVARPASFAQIIGIL